MFYYKVFGLIVSSDIEMTEALSVNVTDEKLVDVHIHKEKLLPEYTNETEAEKQNEYGCIYHYEKEWAFVRFVNQGAFFIRNANEVAYELKENCQMVYVKQIILCFCLTTVLAQRGILAVHGSGLVYNNKALIISGDSGSGKSTLTSELLEHGAGFMADDTVPVIIKDNKVMANAGFPLRKLCKDAVKKYNLKQEEIIYMPDAGEEKYAKRVADEEFCHNDTELGGIVVINVGKCEHVTIKEVTGAVKLKILTENLYKKVVYESIGFGKTEFEQGVKIINAVPIYQLTRPEGKMSVDEQVKILKETLWSI